jgi:hypothetical protein
MGSVVEGANCLQKPYRCRSKDIEDAPLAAYRVAKTVKCRELKFFVQYLMSLLNPAPHRGKSNHLSLCRGHIVVEFYRYTVEYLWHRRVQGESQKNQRTEV